MTIPPALAASHRSTAEHAVFAPGDDPGSSFRLLRASAAGADCGRRRARRVPHATTCVALRFADGVVMAGDRRATAGNLISHRAMEKVVEADRHSGVAIAGAAGPAMEMVRLFQLQLEHYEKVEGIAAQPGGQGQPAVDDDPRQPAGGDDGPRRRADLRRLRPAPRASAGCGPTTSPAAATRSASTSPPARAACTPARSSSSATATASTATAAVDLACRALWEAADADSATGGPDALRGIYPIVATITADGFDARRRRRAGRSATQAIADALRQRAVARARDRRRATTEVAPHDACRSTSRPSR